MTAPRRGQLPEDDSDTEEDMRRAFPGSRNAQQLASGRWQDLIEPGSVIDVLDSAGKWCECQVVRLVSRGGGSQFVKVRPVPPYDRRADRGSVEDSISIGSRRLAPLGTHTYRIGCAPRPGQRLEVRDQDQVWREAEIVDLRQDRVLVGFTNSGGLRIDLWLNVDSQRVRPCCGDRGADPAAVAAAAAASPENDDQNVRRNRNNAPPQPHVDEDGDDVPVPPRHFVSVPRGRLVVPLRTEHKRAIAAASERYTRYLFALRKHGLRVQPIPGDGNCLFRSVSHQIYGDDRFHGLIRERCMDYMEAERAYFEPYVEGGVEGFAAYVEWKRQNAVWGDDPENAVWGDDPEVQALCEIYDCAAEIWAYDARNGARMLRTFHEATGDSIGNGGAAAAAAGAFSSSGGSAVRVMRLSYYGGGHYDSLVPMEWACAGGYYEGALYAGVMPGVLEAMALERSRARRAQQERAAAAAAAGDGGAAAGAADRVGETAIVELALQQSRDEFDAQPGALEQALAASLSLTDETADVAAATSASELLAMQEEMLASAQAQSEADALAAALSASVRDKAAAAAAAGGSGGAAGKLPPPQRRGAPPAAGAPAAAVLAAEDEEEAELRLALAASLRPQDGSGGSAAAAAAAARADDEAELQRALAASLQADGGSIGGGRGGLSDAEFEALARMQAAELALAQEDDDLRRALQASLEGT
ncbi:hypothetical protein JKP88DRAFT_334777 [Tribonema minus]|uniref:ubiquitinyl hydrolase 1 n=1 Tax=Tribonema minus TaxID=303371 RepID=A0A835YK15_9STRA|nr:hypothetical protein JKP88DRAFT_334777 [Tribonema minus]